MRVALCLSGQPRVIAPGFKSIKESIIEPILHRAGTLKQWDTDVFVHTWTDWKYVNRHGGQLDGISNIGEISNLYSPKSLLVESQMYEYDNFEWTKHPCNGVPRYFNAIAMFYSIMKCNELRKQYEQYMNVKYDVIIRSRFDVEIIDTQNFIMGVLPPEKYNNNIIYGWQQCEEFFNDQIFWGNPTAMNSICDTYKHLESITEPRLWRTGEFLMMEVAKMHNIQLSNCGGIRWRLLRP